MTSEKLLVSAAKAEDTQDLLKHIAWTDVLLPKLTKAREDWSKMLVGHLLGQDLPGKLTKEQVAGMIFGIEYITNLIARILKDGERAIEELRVEGIHLTALNL